MAGYIGKSQGVTQVDGYNRSEADAEFVNDPNDVITVSGGNVGIGTTSPARPFSVVATGNTTSVFERTDGTYVLEMKGNGTTSPAALGMSTNDLVALVNNAERMRIDSSGNVGIGTASPTQLLTVGDTGTTYTRLQFYASTSGASTIHFGDGTSGADNYRGYLNYAHDSNSMQFATSGTERMRIDSSGNLLVGTTDVTIGYSDGDVGFAVDGANGYFGVARSPSASTQALAYLNRLNSDGDIVQFRKDGTTVGSIGSVTNAFFLSSSRNELNLGSRGSTQSYMDVIGGVALSTSTTYDGASDLGRSNARFDDIYATNGTIQTSDRNEKQDIEALSDAEQRVAVAAKGLLRKYRWKDAVAEKGDAARIHFGIIAQDLQAAFEAEGLDAGRYGMFISSTWWEADRVIPAVEAQDAVYETVVIPAEYDADGNEISPETTEERLVSEAVEAQPERTVTDTYETQEEAPEGAVERTRMGVRYPELLAFIIAAL